ncbi:MAG: TonB-dependent receptor [Crocinitomicaceae bacterium]|nr:TonB-dependent receptor [Crocinitomicaceae bacterium]MBK8926736.1 TonB-dependent receptor [Crocinitomicaceae bacterium]
MRLFRQKQKIVRLVPYAFVFVLMLPFAVYAQPDTVRVLNPVNIFSVDDSILRITDVHAIAPHYQLNDEKLMSLSAGDVGQAFRFVPGIQLKDYGGIGGVRTVSFRTLGANHTAVISDGIKLPNAQSGTINLGAFELFGLDLASFSTGNVNDKTTSASAYIYSNSISIQSVLSKKPETFRMKIYSGYSTVSLLENGFLIQAPIKKNWFVGAQGMMRNGTGNYPFIYLPSGSSEVQTRNNSDLLSYKLRLVSGYENEQSSMLINALYFNNHQQLPGAIILYNNLSDQELWNEDMRFDLQQKFNFKKFTLRYHAFYQRGWLRYYDPGFLNAQGFLDNSYLQQNAGTGFMMRRKSKSNTVEFFSGADFISSFLEGSSMLLKPQRSELNAVAGVHGVYQRIKISAYLTGQFIHDKIDSANLRVIQNRFELSPFISAGIQPVKNIPIKLRGHYKRVFVMPSFNDLYYNFIGNTELKPETGHLFNAGLMYTIDKKKLTIELTADGFYGYLKNKIIAIPTKDLFNWSMQNIGIISTKGTDLSLLIQYRLKKISFTWNTTYTYNLSTDITSEESNSYGDQVPYVPFHSGTFGMLAEFYNFQLGCQGLYTGGRYILNENNYANYLEKITDINLQLAMKLELSKTMNFRLSVACKNILNKNYEVIKSFPMPGRHVEFKLNFEWK